ncbi:MAG: ankyrin repeat domain-containing protein [Bacteroidota bacterium]
MENSEIKDALFLEAVEAIDGGYIDKLKNLVTAHPGLIKNKLDYPEGAYFKDPYLLWFVADNPIRKGKLPANIVEITRLLVEAVKREATESAQQQLDYALGLVATGRIPRECGVQIEMIDLFIDEGAKPGGGLGALAHGNIAAAERLIERGGKLTLAAAVGLDRMDDVKRMATDKDELLTAITVAAMYGKAHMIAYLIGLGANPNGYPESKSGFHSHATPLHQAVSSGSLECVKLLVEAGADLQATDKAYGGTPLGWALYMPTEDGNDDDAKKKWAAIAEYLGERINQQS